MTPARGYPWAGSASRGDQIRKRLNSSCGGGAARDANRDQFSQLTGTREATGRMINGSCGTIAAVGASAWASICWPKSQCDTHTLMDEPDRLAISLQSVGIA